MTRTITRYLYDSKSAKPLQGIPVDAFRTDTGALVTTVNSDTTGKAEFTGMDDTLTYKIVGRVPGNIQVWDERGQGVWVYLAVPKTSTSWDGDAYSTTAPTLIDLSAVFGIPAGVKAVAITIQSRDSASAGGDYFVRVGPSATYRYAVINQISGLPNDSIHATSGICPCDANGDIYYEIAASGASTMDVWLRIWGYVLP